jgi:hypothetical protein
MNMRIQYYNKIRWGLATLAPNDAPPPGVVLENNNSGSIGFELGPGNIFTECRTSALHGFILATWTAKL